MALTPIIVEYNDLQTEVIDMYLDNKVFHISNVNHFDSIINDGYIRASNPDKYASNYSQSKICFGYKENAVCLLDYRNLDRDSCYYSTSTSMFFDECYIFVLKQDEYSNIIEAKSQETFNEIQTEKYFIPHFECWYKDKITLNKIENVLHIIYVETEEEKFRREHSLIGMAIEYEKALKDGSR